MSTRTLCRVGRATGGQSTSRPIEVENGKSGSTILSPARTPGLRTKVVFQQWNRMTVRRCITQSVNSGGCGGAQFPADRKFVLQTHSMLVIGEHSPSQKTGSTFSIQTR